MADPNIELSISLEKTVHESLKKVIQEVMDKYGLEILSLAVNWQNVSTIGKPPKRLITSVTIESKSY